MLHKAFRRAVGAAVIVGILGSSAPLGAQWRDSSDSLPGLSSGKKIAIIAAAAVGVLVVFWMIKRSRNKPANPTLVPGHLEFVEAQIGESLDRIVTPDNQTNNTVNVNGVLLSGRVSSVETTIQFPIVVARRSESPLRLTVSPNESRVFADNTSN